MKVSKDDHKIDIGLVADDYVEHIPKRGILHIGAHQGEEVDHYLKLGFQNIILIEANPQWYEFLITKFKDNPRIKIFGVAVSDVNGEIDFHIHTSRSGSTEPASLLKMKEFNKIVKTLQTADTIKVEVITLNEFFVRNNLSPHDYNFMNIDIQGAELMAFKGASDILKTMDVIISEVNLIELYENAPLENDIIDYLAGSGFVKVNAIYHNLYDERGTFPAWGECLFIKNSLVN
jgi:FkbM family methyltransferase